MATEYTYDPDSHAYRDERGLIVPFRAMVSIRDGFVSARQVLVRDLAVLYTSGAIDLDTFITRFRAITAESLAALFLLGGGGAAAVTARPLSLSLLQTLLDRQMPFASSFFDDIRAGSLSDAEIGARAALYQEAAVTSYEQAAADSWGIELPFYPADHGTECESNCRCSWEITTVTNPDTGQDETYATWNTMGDAKVCSGCRQRASEWQNQRIA